MLKTYMLKKTGKNEQHKTNRIFNTKYTVYYPVFIDKYDFYNNMTRLINISFLLKGEIND